MTMRRIVAPLVIALVVLAALALGVAWMPLRSARDAWQAGNDSLAIADAERWSSLHAWPGQYHQLLAAAYLTAGNPAAAKPHLDALSKGTLWISIISEEDVARRLFARRRYADFLAYDGAVHDRDTPRNIPLYRVAALTALNRIDEAATQIEFLYRSGVDPKKTAVLDAAIKQRKAGAYPLVFARDGSVIATVKMQTGDLVADDG